MLLDFLNFTFGSGFWRFAGVTLLLLIVAGAVASFRPVTIIHRHDRED
jgi:hypothetical protein